MEAAMADNVSEIQKLYVEYFGRPADPSGLNFWVRAMNQDPNVITQIQTDFAQSAEYQANYGGMSNHDAVEAVYHNMFGRVGDADGVKFWTDALDNHWVTIEHVVSEMVKAAQTAQNNDSIVFNGRLAVSVEYTNHLDTPAEVAAYSGQHAFGIAEGFIGSIVDLTSAAMARDPGAIDANIAQIVGSTQGVAAPHFVA
jgi:hypothetical protein